MRHWRAEPTPADRLLGWLIALSGLLMISTRVPRILHQIPDFATWWTALAAAPLLTVVLLALLGRWLPARVLRPAWAFANLSLALALLLVCAGYRGSELEALIPWVWSLEASVICLLVLLLRPAFAVLAGLSMPMLPLLSALLFLDSVPREILLQTPIHLGNIALLVIFLGIRVRLLQLATAENEANLRIAEQHRAETLAQHRSELARTIHDEVLSVLTAATMLPGRVGAALERETRLAVEVLAHRAPPAGCGEWEGRHLVALLRAETESIAPGAEFRARSQGEPVPAHVGAALLSAAREALRNAREHAGPDAAISVSIEVSVAGVAVRIADTGPGFDPARVPPERLGVAKSILERINELPGGRAEIRARDVSAPVPRGTLVELSWRAP